MARVGIASGSDDFVRSSGSSNQSKVHIDFESIRLHVSSWAARVQSRISLDTLRPLPLFLGINPTNSCFSAEAFTPVSLSTIRMLYLIHSVCAVW